MGWDRLTRRQTLIGFAAAGGIGSALGLAGCDEKQKAAETFDASFGHGVASGDPKGDAIIIWTRVTTSETSPVPVRWTVAADPDFGKVIAEGESQASAASDHTVKVDVTDLTPGETYYYRFSVGDTLSPVGRTKTLPAQTERARFAVISCSHYAFGYYHVYREISALDDLDAVVHLGDYIYEYGRDGYGGAVGRKLGREHEPSHEIVTLADYRTRFAQYRSDPDLQAAHAAAPFITVWDDHETANNSWVGGAGNHDPETEGKWETRRNAALKAYFEWMPMRDPEPGKAFYTLNRTYEYGKVASLHVIETRLTGRDNELSYQTDMVYEETAFDLSDPANPVAVTGQVATGENIVRLKTPYDAAGAPVLDYARMAEWQEKGLPEGFSYKPDAKRFREEVLNDPARHMMGEKQQAWLAGELKHARAGDIKWQVLGNQIVMARMDAPDFTKAFPADLVEKASAANPFTRRWLESTKLGLPINLDSWDGYPAARERLYRGAKAAEANLLVLAGDSHNFWANDLHDDAGDLVGVEFGTTSVTSQSGYKYLGDDPRIPGIAKETMIEHCPEVKFCDVEYHGFVLLDLTAEKADANYLAVSTVLEPEYETMSLARFTVTADEPGKLSGLTRES